MNARKHEWMNEGMKEWMNEWMNEWMKERKSQWCSTIKNNERICLDHLKPKRGYKFDHLETKKKIQEP